MVRASITGSILGNLLLVLGAAFLAGGLRARELRFSAQAASTHVVSLALAVGGYIAAAYWFTSSTSFANPAVTLARSLSDTLAGIAPSSVPGFVLAQVLGGGLGLAAVVYLFPRRTPLPEVAE